MSGAGQAAAVQVSASSGRPSASLPISSMVAGAMTSTSAQLASRMCVSPPADSDHRSLKTGRFVRFSRLNGVMKRAAAGDMTARTSAPRSINRRATSTALKAAMPPPMPRRTLLPARISSVAPYMRVVYNADRIGPHEGAMVRGG